MPDAEARVMPDGRLYLYGSWDIPEKADYCTKIFHCFSTDDLVNWTDLGIIYRNDEEFCGIPWAPETNLYAPDAIHRDGKYYLYVCGSSHEEGVAVADSPTGPFSVAERVVHADGDSIDPAVFIDDDGQAYYLWGQFSLRGAKLNDDMKTIDEKSIVPNILTEWEHGFHEGASIRKRNGKYYIVYTDITRGKATCMSYAVADSPLGPYTKGGVIVDNIYCDPETWNDHGSINEFKGQWYVFYHRSSQKRKACRRVCAEKIEFDENGFIKEVCQTSSGTENALRRDLIPARAACRMIGNCHVAQRDGREVLISEAGGHWGIADWAEYKYIDMLEGDAKTFFVNAKGKGKVTLKMEGDVTLSSIDVDSEEYKKFTGSIQSISGKHSFWLFVEGDMVLTDIGFN